MKIWLFYFEDLSKWIISNIELSNVIQVLDIGYGGGFNVKNLVELNKNWIIYGVDIFEEFYKIVINLNKKVINNGKVELFV